MPTPKLLLESTFLGRIVQTAPHEVLYPTLDGNFVDTNTFTKSE
jgi:hypothetical protein